jgi:predicted RNase H-like HicB family nuclease
MKYVVIFEKYRNNYGAYVPDLPGCAVVGETMEEVRKLIAEAIDFHIEGLQEAGYDVPLPSFTLSVQTQQGVSSELIEARI